MSRNGGFEVGDRSTRTLHDSRLIRAYQVAGLGAVVAWDAIVDASWAQGERVTLEEALLDLPFRVKVAAVRAALTEFGLLDSEGRIREESWATWFLPVYQRREDHREAARRYARKAIAVRWQNRQQVDDKSMTS